MARLAWAFFAVWVATGLTVEVADAIDGAALQKGSGGYWHLVLPTEMSSALERSFPTFNLWPDSLYDPALRRRFVYTEHESPFAQIRDLNRDGFEDVVLDGRVGSDYALVLLRSEGNRYEAIEAKRKPALDSGPMRPGRGLVLDAPPSPHETRDLGAYNRTRHIWWSEPEQPDLICSIDWSDSLQAVVGSFGVAIRCFGNSNPDSTRISLPRKDR